MQVLNDLSIHHRDALSLAQRLFVGGDLAAGEVDLVGVDGAKAALVMSIWAGWISVLPSKPKSRPSAHSAASPTSSRKAL
jgi:hypothetical protein